MDSNPLIGGQAVVEGVMMRGPKSFVVSVRRADGTIVTHEEALRLFPGRWKALRWPILRGVVTLLETLILGIKAINFSASQALADEETKEGEK